MPPDTKIPNNLEIDKELKEFESKNAQRLEQTTGLSKTSENLANLEISRALREFDEKSTSEIPQKDVKDVGTLEVPRMVRLVMKLSGGAIKEQKQAEYVLLGLIIIMFATSAYFFFGGGSSSQKPSPAELEQMQNMMPVNQQSNN